MSQTVHQNFEVYEFATGSPVKKDVVSKIDEEIEVALASENQEVKVENGK